MPTRILFIRHGETDWNAEGRLQGQKDIPLNDEGRRQAAQSGRILRAITRKAGTIPWIVSPLGRTRETAHLAREALGLPREGYRLEPLIKELSFGEWEGKTWREVRRAFPEAARGREGDKWNYVPPGGESYAMLAQRVRPWLASLEGDVIAVSHGGVARTLLHLMTGLDCLAAPVADIWQGRVLVLEAGRSVWSG